MATPTKTKLWDPYTIFEIPNARFESPYHKHCIGHAPNSKRDKYGISYRCHNALNPDERVDIENGVRMLSYMHPTGKDLPFIEKLLGDIVEKCLCTKAHRRSQVSHVRSNALALLTYIHWSEGEKTYVLDAAGQRIFKQGPERTHNGCLSRIATPYLPAIPRNPLKSITGEFTFTVPNPIVTPPATPSATARSSKQNLQANDIRTENTQTLRPFMTPPPAMQDRPIFGIATPDSTTGRARFVQNVPDRTGEGSTDEHLFTPSKQAAHERMVAEEEETEADEDKSENEEDEPELEDDQPEVDVVDMHDTLLSLLKTMTGIETKLAVIDENVQSLDERFGKVNERLGKLDERLGEMDERFDEMDESLKAVKIQPQIPQNEWENNFTQISDLMNDMRADIVKLYDRLPDAEDEESLSSAASVKDDEDEENEDANAENLSIQILDEIKTLKSEIRQEVELASRSVEWQAIIREALATEQANKELSDLSSALPAVGVGKQDLEQETNRGWHPKFVETLQAAMEKEAAQEIIECVQAPNDNMEGAVTVGLPLSNENTTTHPAPLAVIRLDANSHTQENVADRLGWIWRGLPSVSPSVAQWGFAIAIHFALYRATTGYFPLPALFSRVHPHSVTHPRGF